MDNHLKKLITKDREVRLFLIDTTHILSENKLSEMKTEFANNLYTRLFTCCSLLAETPLAHPSLPMKRNALWWSFPMLATLLASTSYLLPSSRIASALRAVAVVMPWAFNSESLMGLDPVLVFTDLICLVRCPKGNLS